MSRPIDVTHHPSTWTALGLEQPLVIAMVGLPARGKSYIVKMIIRYLKWTGFECDVFNVGSYRRKIGLASADSNFFSANNPDAKRVREEMAMAVQEMMYSWLRESEGSKRRVAIFDATNTTKDRRLALAQRARKEGVYLLFVESICDDAAVLQRNYHMKLKNDDYSQMDPKDALNDFMSRVQAYEKVYEVRGTGYALCCVLYSVYV
jgi:transcription termination factor NusB